MICIPAKGFLKNRLGEVSFNKKGTKMVIVEYRGRSDVVVEFQDKYKARKHCEYNRFLKGSIVSPYDPNVYNYGFQGEGIYNSKDHGLAWRKWDGMLRRVYSKEYKNKKPSYSSCTICSEWLNFQIFAEWFYLNYYEIEGQIMCLDKDILLKGNKLYSPETCIIVPNNINCLFTKSDSIRSKDLPIGVYRSGNGFRVYLKKGCIHGKQNSELFKMSNIETKEKAFGIYKREKEKYIKEVADYYKNKIPQRLYSAMYKYEVDICD